MCTQLLYKLSIINFNVHNFLVNLIKRLVRVSYIIANVISPSGLVNS